MTGRGAARQPGVMTTATSPGVDRYGGRITEIYDLMYPSVFGDTEKFIDYARRRSPGRRVLELGIGTGRLALPLADADFSVTGMDASPAMLEVLAQRDVAGRIRTQLGDFTRDRVEGEFDLAMIMVNTLFFATSQDDQVSVFAAVADALTDEGVFLVETFSPSVYHAQRAPLVQMRQLDEATLMVEQYTVEPTSQFLIAQHTVLGRGEPFSFTHLLRYAFPFELDAIARCAGLELVERMAGWNGAPYADGMGRCLSLYRKAAR